jgi:glycosyltransferase involved in cell wall biosynthesis
MISRLTEPAPRVTVLMPVYNGELHVADAIESVLSQSFADFELLIVNDGSTDRTGEIVGSYDDPRVVVIDNPRNLGLGRALNVGVRFARGELMARLDADDVSHPERLARQIALMDSQPSVAMVGTWFTETDAEGRVVIRGTPPADPTAMRWSLLFHCPIIHSTVMLRRSVLEEVGPYDESIRYAEDYDLWTRIARTMIITNVEEMLVEYRQRPESMTFSYGDAVLEGPRRIAVGQMRYVAAAGGEDPEAFDERFHASASSALWRAASGDYDVLLTVRNLFRLHDAFCRAYELAPDAARAHRADIGARLIGNLKRLARSRLRAGDVRGCGTMLTAAVTAYRLVRDNHAVGRRE